LANLNGQLGVICGGSGSSKFVRAISTYALNTCVRDVGFIANVGDNFWYRGLFVCPDIDIITYALSNLLDISKGWGMKSDGFLANKQLSEIEKSPEWFGLGDRDFALSLRRTELLKKGWKLSAITNYLGTALKSSYPVIPSTDDFLQSFVKSNEGMMHLQEYWVKKKGSLEPRGVEYVGLSDAVPNFRALHSCSNNVIICPANPVTSILPTLKLKGFARKLRKARVIGISPFIGNKPFSGPAAKLMAGIGIESNSLGVAKLYSAFMKVFFVDATEDAGIVRKISDLGIECVRTNIRLDPYSNQSVAKELFDAL
jgi:LPPG:FO 2-phospho-L-lactate transferase